MKEMAAKFCKKLVGDSEKYKECVDLAEGMMKNIKNENALDTYIEKLVELTGADTDKIAKTLYNSCPLCDD
jgi:DNA primase